MISCEEALERISLELDGLLDEEGQAELNEHLARCASCRLLREDLRALHRELPALEAEPPGDLTRRVLDQIKPAPRRKRPQVRGLVGIAACALLCAGLWQLRPEPERLSDQVVTGEEFSETEICAASPQEEEPSVPSVTAAAAPALDTFMEMEEKRDMEEDRANVEMAKAVDPGAKGRMPPAGRSNIWPDSVS